MKNHKGTVVILPLGLAMGWSARLAGTPPHPDFSPDPGPAEVVGWKTPPASVPAVDPVGERGPATPGWDGGRRAGRRAGWRAGRRRGEPPPSGWLSPAVLGIDAAHARHRCATVPSPKFSERPITFQLTSSSHLLAPTRASSHRSWSLEPYQTGSMLPMDQS